MTERRLKELKNQSAQLIAHHWYSTKEVDFKPVMPPEIEPIRQPFDGVLTIASVMGRVERVIIIK
jgi:hypothetical protein